METKNNLINKKKFKDLVIYFTRYVNCKSIKMLSLYFFDDYVVYKVLEKNKEVIGIEEIDDTQILISMNDKLSDDITLKRVVILMRRVIKNELFLDHALYDE